MAPVPADDELGRLTSAWMNLDLASRRALADLAEKLTGRGQ